VLLHDFLVAGEGLARGAESVLRTLLHEAAHGLAHVRKIKDTSRQGRYHNRRYQVLAEELGLDVAEAGALGWSSTNLRDATIKQYWRELQQLRSALTISRRGELTADGGKGEADQPASLLVRLPPSHPGCPGDPRGGPDRMRDLR